MKMETNNTSLRRHDHNNHKMNRAMTGTINISARKILKQDISK